MNLQNSTWNNSNIYKNFQDPNIQLDLFEVENAITFIQNNVGVFDQMLPRIETTESNELMLTLPLAQKLTRLKLDQLVTVETLSKYASLSLSTNSILKEGHDLLSKTQKLMANINKAMNSLDLFLLRAPQGYIEEFLKDDSVCELRFQLSHRRTQNDFLLAPETESILLGHAVDGYTAWGRLYTDMASTIKADINGQIMGLAKASSFLFQADRSLREVAHRAINKAWTQFEVPAAAVLNAIYGWRIENYKSRSTQRELNYLDVTCHAERIKSETLQALMDVTYERRSLGHRALKIMAHEMGVDRAAAWDILAAYPAKNATTEAIPFPRAMEIIIEAFGEFSSDMADYAKMAAAQGWIDGEPTENRQTGAYCTRIARTKESRVFMTYQGSMKDVITLAHELGHAYHTWVMRDLPLTEMQYTSSLAETASIFAETLVRAALLRKATTIEQKKKILWQEVESAATFLNNIPARFEFEKNLFEKRKQKTLSPDEMKELTQQAWKHWYEDSLSEYNEMFWASKMHFHMSRMSFYNYPYLFGYLFSLGIYAQKDSRGDQFSQLYVDLLRDTGRMTPENLIQKYFNEDISQKEFWLKPLKVIEQAIVEYEAIIRSEVGFVEDTAQRAPDLTV